MTNLVAEETVAPNEAANGTAHAVRIILRHAQNVSNAKSQNRKALEAVEATTVGDGAEAQNRMVVAVHPVSPVQVTGTAPAELTTLPHAMNVLSARNQSQKALEAVHRKIALVFERTRPRNFIFLRSGMKRRSSMPESRPVSILRNTTTSR